MIADLKIFPQLGTIPRIEFIFAMANEFDQLEDPSDSEDLIAATEPQALTATEDEPENLKLRLACGPSDLPPDAAPPAIAG